MLRREAGVVERRALRNAVGERVARLGVGDVSELCGEFRQAAAFVVSEVGSGHVAQALGRRFGVPAGVDEHE